VEPNRRLRLCHCGKIPAKINLKEEPFMLTHSFRSFSSQSALWQDRNIMAEGHSRKVTYLIAARKQRTGMARGTKYTFPRHVPSDLLSPARPYLLVSPPPNNAIRL
jgi:hypothetical protein